MNQSEQAALQSLQQLEEMPAEHVWHNVSLEGERAGLSQRLSPLEVVPDAKNWNEINSRMPKRNHRMRLAVAGLFVIGAGLVYQTIFRAPDLEDVVAHTPGSERQAATTIPPPPFQSQPKVESTTAPQNSNPPTFASAPTSRKNENEYLWVASKSGSPMRIHKRWSALSCCLSGETQAPECHQQQQQWHQEMEGSSLGFQADPFLGLIELLETAEKPEPFSPTLCP